MLFFMLGIYCTILGAAFAGAKGAFFVSLIWALFGALVVCVRYWMKRKF